MRTNGSWVSRASGVAVAISMAVASMSTFAQLNDGWRVIDERTGGVLNTAVEALNVQKYAEARTAIGKLNLDTLSPYERSKAEQILFDISYKEQRYSEAREHLQKAIEAGGLSPQEISEARRQISLIDARLSTAPNV
jgi:tetratricopeptide (TPR) repeat protein